MLKERFEELVFAIVAAAGKSQRFGGLKKQFLKISNKHILELSVEKLLLCGINVVAVATSKSDINIAKKILNKFKEKTIFLEGGKTRQETVKKAFLTCRKKFKYAKTVLIHDAARPFFDVETVKKLIETAKEKKAAILACPIYDTIKYVKNNKVKQTLNRDNVFVVQTPQAFSASLYEKALKLTENLNLKLTDDSSLLEQINVKVSLVKSSTYNFKITTKEDLKYAEFLFLKEEQKYV